MGKRKKKKEKPAKPRKKKAAKKRKTRAKKAAAPARKKPKTRRSRAQAAPAPPEASVPSVEEAPPEAEARVGEEAAPREGVVAAAPAEEKVKPRAAGKRKPGGEETVVASAPPERGARRRGTTAIMPVAPVEVLISRARELAESDPAGALGAYAELARTGSMSKETALEAAELAQHHGDAELESEFLIQALEADPSDALLREKAYEKARASGEPWAAARALREAVESGEPEATSAHRELVAEAVEEALDLLTLAGVGLARGREINRARKVFSVLLSEEPTKTYLSVEGASSVFMLEGRSRYRASSRRGEVLLVEDVSSGTARLSFRCRGAGTVERARRQAGGLLSKLAEALFSGVEVSRRAGDELACKLSEALSRELEFSQYWPMPDGTLQIIFRSGAGGFETLTLTEGGASIEDTSGGSHDLEIGATGRELSRSRERYVKVSEGIEKLDGGETEVAEACARRALELDPLGAEPNFLMGKVHSARGDWDAAAERLRTAADADPDSPVILNELGLALMRAGKHREAANSFSAAFEYDMRDEYRANLIQAWMLAGDVPRAEKELERLRRKVGEHPDALAQLAHIQLHSDPEKAERMFRRALTLDKKCGLALVGLARVACREKALDEAAYYVERALATKKPDMISRVTTEPDMAPLRATGKLDELLSKATSGR